MKTNDVKLEDLGPLTVFVGRNGAGKSWLCKSLWAKTDDCWMGTGKGFMRDVKRADDPWNVPSSIESLDEGLHPLSQEELVAAIRKHIAHSGQKVFGITYSPYLCDSLKPEELFVVHDRHVKCINEHPKFEQWKDEFAPGEMWSVWGEEWVK